MGFELSTKSEILQLLRTLSDEQPELRVCQIIGNALGAGDHYYVEDQELLLQLKQYRKATG